MSETKFACPVCGQHITADSNRAGAQLECPTCFRKIIIPQASGSSEHSLVLSALEANRPRPPATRAQATARHPGKRSAGWLGFAALLVVFAALGATAWKFGGDWFRQGDGAVQDRSGEPHQTHGAIGVGAWNSQVEYTEISLQKGNSLIYESHLESGAPGWRFFKGNWKAADGILAQTEIAPDCRAIAGSSKWRDYTLSLKARKLGGREGFLILFNVTDKDNWTWWNLGGWNNTRTAIENCVSGHKTSLGTPIPVRIEAGRWYDIRIELQGKQIRCYLDGKLIQEAKYP